MCQSKLSILPLLSLLMMAPQMGDAAEKRMESGAQAGEIETLMVATEAAVAMDTVIADALSPDANIEVIAEAVAPKPPAEVQAFLDRVLKALPTDLTQEYTFKSWEVSGKPTEEGIGIKKFASVNPDKVIKRVMDVDHYVGNLDKVLECRSIPDPRFVAPSAVRFYQRVDLSVLGAIHHELVLVDAGTRKGYHVVYWYLLDKETEALGTKKGARSDYNVGAWFVRGDAIGYSLSSAPVEDDVNYIQWKALTDGADVAAKAVVEANIDGMKKWSSS